MCRETREDRQGSFRSVAEDARFASLPRPAAAIERDDAAAPLENRGRREKSSHGKPLTRIGKRVRKPLMRGFQDPPPAPFPYPLKGTAVDWVVFV